TQHLAYRGYEHDYKFFSAFGVSLVAHTRHRAEYHGDVALSFGGLFYGVDFDRENGSVRNQRHLRNNTGYYVQQQMEAWGRLNLTAGVRIEDNSTFGISTNPKLGVSLRLPANTRVRFSAGTGLMEPSVTENFCAHPVFLGNRDLLHERSRSWEAGFERSFLGSRMMADLTWFDNRFRNLIELVSRPDFSGQFQNIGRSTARGLEFRARARVRQVLLQANYTYLDGPI